MTLEEFLRLFIQSARLDLSFQVAENEETDEVNFKGSAMIPSCWQEMQKFFMRCNTFPTKSLRSEGRKIILDCNGYRETRAEELRLIALTASESVKRSGTPFKLSPMSPEERRIVHLAIAEDSAIRTESEGFGENRRVVIYPKGDAHTP